MEPKRYNNNNRALKKEASATLRIASCASSSQNVLILVQLNLSSKQFHTFLKHLRPLK